MMLLYIDSGIIICGMDCLQNLSKQTVFIFVLDVRIDGCSTCVVGPSLNETLNLSINRDII